MPIPSPLWGGVRGGGRAIFQVKRRLMAGWPVDEEAFAPPHPSEIDDATFCRAPQPPLAASFPSFAIQRLAWARTLAGAVPP